MIAPVFTGHVSRDGEQIKLDRPTDFARQRKRLAGKPVEVVLRVPKAQRSTEQNKYYWGVVIALLAEYCGYAPEEMHDALKMHFLQREEQGKPLPTIRSTASLSTKEFEEYMDSVRQWARVEHNVHIPLPNEAEAC